MVFTVAAVCIFLLFQVVAVPALILRRNDFADVLWGPGFLIASLVAAGAGGAGLAALDTRSLLVLSLVGIWSVRLVFHVGIRNLSHRHEDVRYANWRRQWGNTWLWRSWLQVFVLQAVIMFLFLLPVLHILESPSRGIGVMTVLGAAVWAIGFFFEAVGDEQLRRFKKNPANKGRLMTEGLWRWTRHPNYFGEVVLWWGIWLIAVEDPGAWWTVISPFGVTYLLLKVSGVSMMEELMKNRAGFADYAKRVPPFFPRWPRRP